MNWIVAKIKWIMLVTGALTGAMLFAAIWPSEAVDLLFDRTLESGMARVIVPSWAAHVGLMGAMLIYGAFSPHVRTLTLTVVGSSKLAFLGLMLAQGRQYLDERVGIVIALDMVMVALFAIFLFSGRRTRALRESVSQPIMPAVARGNEGTRPSAPAAGGKAPLPARTTATARVGPRPGPSS